MTIEDCECLSAHQHACPAISEIRLCTNIILVFDFNDICHDLPGRSTKNVDLVAGGVIGKNLTSASYKSQGSQVHTATWPHHGKITWRNDRLTKNDLKLNRWSSSKYQRNNEQHQEDHKQDVGNPRRRPGYSCEAENPGYDRDD